MLLPILGLASEPPILTARPGYSATFNASAKGAGHLTYQWYKNGNTIIGATEPALQLPRLSPNDSGDYHAKVGNFYGYTTSDVVRLVVSEETVPPRFYKNLVSISGAVGNTATLAPVLEGSPPFSFQWYKNDIPLPAASSATLTFSSLNASDSGYYQLLVKNAAGSVLSERITIKTELLDSSDSTRISNLSVRARVEATGGPMIVGFNVAGGEKELLLRAIGPSLSIFGINEQLEDPTLTLFKGSDMLAENDDWGSEKEQVETIGRSFANAGAFSLLGSTSKDSALLARLDGLHTMHVQDTKGASSGTALLEIYDLGPPNGRKLSNLSVKGSLQGAKDNLILGFTIDGNGTKRVLIRAVGPSLSAFSVSNPLNDTILQLYKNIDGTNQLLSQNNDWGGTAELATTFQTVGAFPLPLQSLDSALIAELTSGAYSAVLVNGQNAPGDALIEIYEIH